MKKIFYSTGLLFCASLMMVTGCKKDNTPFPTNPQSNDNPYSDYSFTTPYFPSISNADAIFISAQVNNVRAVTVSDFLLSYEYGMAKFATSTGNFSSLMDGGTVTLNDTTLVKSSDNSYLSPTSDYTIGLLNSITWNIGGNNYAVSGTMPSYTYPVNLWDKSWLPLKYIKYDTEYVPPRPSVTHVPNHSDPNFNSDSIYYYTNLDAINTYITDSTQRANDSIYDITVAYSIPLKNYLSDADSVSLVLIDGSGFKFVKTAPSSDTLIPVLPKDFEYYSSVSYDANTYNVQVNAISYQPQMVSGKNYYFLKMASYIKYSRATK